MEAAADPSAAPVTLFYSYAHEDEPLRDELQGHLKLLERRGLLAPWHDREIVAGADWGHEIDVNLQRAELVLLLVSKDFIESDYIMGVELAAAMQRHAAQAATVVPIIVRAVDLEPEDADDLPFLKLQGLPTDLKPVTSWPNRDEAWTNVAKGLRETVKAIRERRPLSSPMAAAPAAVSSPVRSPPTSRQPSLQESAVAYTSAPATAPRSDPLVERLVDEVAQRIDTAQRARSPAPLDAQAAHAVRAETRALIDLPEQQRVLWVDDRPEGNRLEIAALNKLQIEVVSVTDTDAALQRLRTDTEGFDLIISDWERPAEGRGAGLQLLARLPAKVPLIYYHAEFGAGRAERTREALAAGAFGEAVLPAELFGLVAQALDPVRPG